jgi:uracil phosphoribosyltransferase
MDVVSWILSPNSIMASFGSQVLVLESRALKHLFTKIRDENTSSADFAFYSSRIMRILAEEVC